MTAFTQSAHGSLTAASVATPARRHRAAVRAAAVSRAGGDNRHNKTGDGEGDVEIGLPGTKHATRRSALFGAATASLAAAVSATAPLAAFAEFSENTEYMPSLEGKDYGKSKYTYPDFVQTKSGIQAGGNSSVFTHLFELANFLPSMTASLAFSFVPSG